MQRGNCSGRRAQARDALELARARGGRRRAAASDPRRGAAGPDRRRPDRVQPAHACERPARHHRRGSSRADRCDRRRLRRRREERSGRALGVRAPVRAPDVQGHGERQARVARPLHRRCRRLQQCLHGRGHHQLLRDRSVESPRTAAVGRGRSHGEPHRRPAELRHRTQGRDRRVRPERAGAAVRDALRACGRRVHDASLQERRHRQSRSVERGVAGRRGRVSQDVLPARQRDAGARGDLDPAQANGWVDRYFGPLKKPAAAIPRVTAVEPVQTKQLRIAYTSKGAPLPATLIAYKIPADRSDDTAALDVLGFLLGQGPSSRLRTALVDGGIASQVIARANTYQQAGAFVVYAFANSGRTTAELETALEAQIARLRDEPVSAAELEKAKTQAIASLVRMSETHDAVAQRIVQAAVIDGDPVVVNRRAPAYARVSAADLQRVARAYLTVAKSTVVAYEAAPAAL